MSAQINHVSVNALDLQRDLTPTSHHHLGITVADLEPAYRAAGCS
jgi:hypothetical protein